MPPPIVQSVNHAITVMPNFIRESGQDLGSQVSRFVNHVASANSVSRESVLSNPNVLGSILGALRNQDASTTNILNALGQNGYFQNANVGSTITALQRAGVNNREIVSSISTHNAALRPAIEGFIRNNSDDPSRLIQLITRTVGRGDVNAAARSASNLRQLGGALPNLGAQASSGPTVALRDLAGQALGTARQGIQALRSRGSEIAGTGAAGLRVSATQMGRMLLTQAVRTVGTSVIAQGGVATVGGLLLGAGIHYSGLGRVIGTDSLGESIGDAIYRRMNP